MIDTNELRALRTLATGKYWERYGFIGSGGLDKVRCPTGCDRVGRQLYTEIPASGDDAKFICYVANNAIDIADELDALRADNERLTQENAALRELVERQQLGLDEAYKLMPYLHQYVSDGTELDGMVQVWLDNYEAMKRGAK